MTNQRLRNLTTGRLHTKMEDIYADMEFITSETGLMTHHLPNALQAMTPWLKDKVTEPRFWDGQYDTGHDGDTELAPMNPEERAEFFKRFNALPSLLLSIGKNNPHPGN